MYHTHFFDDKAQWRCNAEDRRLDDLAYSVMDKLNLSKQRHRGPMTSLDPKNHHMNHQQHWSFGVYKGSTPWSR